MKENESPQAVVMDQSPKGLKQKAQHLYKRYEVYAPAAFFILGFLFDILTLSRIDDIMTLVQQAVYLLVLTFLVSLEIVNERRPFIFKVLRGRAETAWTYRELVIHFLFGSLLSVYTLFFFKSASFESSFIFLTLLSIALVGNEMERFQRLGPYMRFGLLSLCYTCFFCYVFPIVFGFGGILPFLTSIVLSSILILILYRYLAKLSHLPDQPADERFRKLALWPGLGIQVLFLILYVFQLIPPVPLSAQYMGVYHQLEKVEGEYRLQYDRPWWKIWQNGAQTFLARPGDRVYVFARVFAPKGFRDDVRVRWLYKDAKLGWQSSDAIPFSISGGRDQGFRGYAFKQNFSPGPWMAKLETIDGREISRIRFEIIADQTDDERYFETDVF